MSDNNAIAVANGNSPQPNAENAQPSNYDQTLEDAEAAYAAEDEVAVEASPEQAIDAAAQKGDITKAQAKNLKKKLQLKVDGEEIEKEYDPNDEEAIKKEFQKALAFDKRTKEFSSYKSQVDQILQMLQNDPEALLEKMGYDVDGLAEKRLSRKVEELKKSPEQLEKDKMVKELEDLRKEKKAAEQAKEKAELEKMRDQQAQQIETDITDALNSVTSILPKGDPLVMNRIAQTMLFAMKNGFPEVTAKDVIPLVEKQWREELNAHFNRVPEDVLEQLVGKSNIDRYRKKKVASRPKVQTATANQIAQDTGKKAVDEKPSEKKRMKDFFRNY